MPRKIYYLLLHPKGSLVKHWFLISSTLEIQHLSYFLIPSKHLSFLSFKQKSNSTIFSIPFFQQFYPKIVHCLFEDQKTCKHCIIYLLKKITPSNPILNTDDILILLYAFAALERQADVRRYYSKLYWKIDMSRIILQISGFQVYEGLSSLPQCMNMCHIICIINYFSRTISGCISFEK